MELSLVLGKRGWEFHLERVWSIALTDKMCHSRDKFVAIVEHGEVCLKDLFRCRVAIIWCNLRKP